MKEKWLPVAGFEGLYEVSDLGRVRSLDHTVKMRNRWGSYTTRLVKGRVLKPCWFTNTSGNRYVRYNFSREGVIEYSYVHAVMLEAFVGPRPPGFEGAHLDGDSTHNVLGNLEWKSAQGNADDRVRHGTTTKGETNPMAKLTVKKVLAIRADVAAGTPARDVAARYGTRTNNVTRIVKRQRWAHI